MRLKTLIWVPMLAPLVFCSACGSGGDGNGSANPGPSGSIADVATALGETHGVGETYGVGRTHGIGYVGSSRVVNDARNLLILAIETVRAASERTGRLTTVGRVEEVNGVVTYTPTEGNELVLVLNENGQPVEVFMVIGEMTGEGNGEAFLASNHSISVQGRLDGVFNFQAASQRNGPNVFIQVDGQMVRSGAPVTVNVTRQGTEVSEGDSTGASGMIANTTSGSMVGSGFTAELSETFRSEFQQSESRNALGSRSTYANTVRIGEDTFAFQDVEFRRSFRNGAPSNFDIDWSASGRITRNGEDYGNYEKAEEIIDAVQGQGFFVFWLRLPDANVEIERWQRIP